MINFGDIFEHSEKEYVFLAKTEEIIYAGHILNKEKTQEIHDLSEKRACKPHSQKYENPLFCFVILNTENFRDKMANFYNTQKGGELSFNIYDTLNETDLKNIKNEICRENSPVPRELKEMISKIDI